MQAMLTLNPRHYLFLLVLVFASSTIGCGGDDSADELPLNSRVIMIGDSFFAKHGFIPDELEKLSGERYRHYYVNGAELGGTSADSISNQYAEARVEDPDIRTALMVGGGNDILEDPNRYCWDGAEPPDSDCQDLIDSVMSVGQELIDTMYADGVENLVFLFYPHFVDFDAIDYTFFNPAIDYAYTVFEDIVDPGLEYYCIVDPRSAFEGHNEYFVKYDIHPSRKGASVIASMIWDNMKSNGIEQGD